MMNEQALELMTEWFPKLKELSNSVYVAGGAARDIYLGRPVKDVDFVVSIYTSNLKVGRAYGAVKHWLSSRGFYSASQDPSDSEYGSGFNVYKHTKDPIDIILTTFDDPLEFVRKTFDIGLCMIALDDEGNFLFNDRFEFDSKYQQLTAYIHPGLTEQQVGRCFYEHLPRLGNKYPEHGYTVRYIPIEACDSPNWILTHHE